MARELRICTSTEAAESDDDDDEERARRTPNNSCSCTPRSSSSAPAAAGPSSSSAMFYRSNPGSSQNSPRRSANFLNLRNSEVVPIITLKTRHLSGGGRDQVAVDEEVWQLKRALLEKDIELRRRKAHAANVEAENRKLVKDIEHAIGATKDPNLNQQGARIESPHKLHTKLASMKLMLEEAYNTCELQSIELYNLRRDVSFTHARELEVERNVYAAEVRRLQEVVKKLKVANGRIGHENHMVCRLKAKNHHLEVMNLRLSSCLSASLNQTPTTPKTPRTPRTQQPRQDALVRSSFGGFDYIQQQENAFSNRLSVSPAACLPR